MGGCSYNESAGSIITDYNNPGHLCPKLNVLNDELLEYAMAILHITSISILWFLMAHILCLVVAFDIT